MREREKKKEGRKAGKKPGSQEGRKEGKNTHIMHGKMLGFIRRISKQNKPLV